MARQGLQYLERHAPDPLWRRLQDGTDIVVAFAQDINKGLAVQTQLHRPAQYRIVKGRRAGYEEIGPAFIGFSSQTACGAWLLTSFNNGTVTS